MRHLYVKSVLIVLATGFSLSASAFGNPCMPIAKACMAEHYYKGGHDKGMGLVEDCVKPVTEGTKIFPNVTFTDDQLERCKMKVIEEMNAQNKTR